MADDETPTEAPAKRLTLSQIVELLLTRSSDRSVVSLTRTTKGETQIEVQVRTADNGDVQTVEDAAAKAREVYDGLREQYPATEADDAVIELTRNARGETQIEVQVRASAAGDITTADAASEHATKLFRDLRGRFPLASGYVSAVKEAK